MQFTFLDMAGKTLFIRDDAERAQWTQEEMSLELEFPRIEGKVISIGQRVFFKDPTGAQQIYEVKQARTFEPDNYQIVVAEHICISELSDNHIDNSEINNKTASNALQGVLNGTQWRVGDSLTNSTSSGDISRGSVWQAVLQIKDNWNVYIEPRVILNSDGSIARYLDIISTSGVWNGLRLSIDKNMLDPSVTYDDSDVVTALYGYGGTIAATTPEGENTECTFKDVVWSATSQHPAKPRGQKYIEDPAATLAYGRNGRARFGFYQNTDIKDPNILLEKTWESLKANSKPAISIDGTVADLYRMGYADTPIKLHDIALVEVLPAGYKDQIQIIRITTDLLDPSATTLTIGSYIPNIVYIERQTNESATGSRGGGGKNTSDETAWREFRTTMEVYEDGTGMKIRAVQNDLNNTKEEVAVQEAQIEVAYNRITQEVTDRRNADATLQGRITVEANRITQEVTDRRNGEEALSGRITVEANRITQEVTDRQSADTSLSGRITTESNRISLVVEGTGANAHIKAAQIVTSINNASSSVLISANHIRLDGNTTVSGMFGVENGSLNVKGNAFINGNLTIASGKEIIAGAVRATSVRFPGANPGDDTTLVKADVAAMLVKAEVVDNVLTITDHSGNAVTFSKATSLSDGWSSNTYTVTATQNGVQVGSKSTSPFVQPLSSQGGSYVDLYVATSKQESPYYDTHGNVKKLYLVQSGLRVDLKDQDSTSAGSVYAQTTIPNATVSGSWSGGTWTATSTHGGSASVSPFVQPLSSQGGAYVDLYVATSKSTSPYYETHGTVEKLYLVTNNKTVYLKSENSTSSGTIYAQKSVSDVYDAGWQAYYDASSYWQKPSSSNGWVCKVPKRDQSGSETWFDVDAIGYKSNSMVIRQISGYASARKMKLYFTDNTVTTIPSGFHEADGGSTYWYHSGTDLNQTGSNKTVYY